MIKPIHTAVFSRQLPMIVAVIAACHFILAVIFSFGPIYEGPDEMEHYRFIRYLAANGALPPPDGQPYGQYHQAPLYYMLLAPLAALVPDDKQPDEIASPLNPYRGYRFDLDGNDNKNVYIHTSDEAFPFSDKSALAIHVLRLTSPFLGAITVLLSFRIFRLLWPQQPDLQLIGLSLVAFWPSLIYIFSVLNNDSLAIPLSTAALYLALRQQRDGATWRGSIVLGFILGAALLTKVHSVMLVVPVGLAVLTDRRAWKYATATLAVTAAVAGWWYARNILLFGDPIGLEALRTTWPSDRLHADGGWLETGLSRLNIAYARLWARFGHGAVSAPAWVYWLFDGALILAAAGVAGTAIKTRSLFPALKLRQALVIGGMFGGYFCSLVYYSGTAVNGNQGRYLLPAIVPIVTFLTIGLGFWLRPISPKYRPILVGGSTLITAVALLFGVFFPAYLPVEVPAAIPAPREIRYGESATLIGMSPAALTARPGEILTVELYWQAHGPGPATLQTYLHAFNGEAFMWRDSLPGNGNRPAHDWKAGEVWGERYRFEIPASLTPGEEYLITAGLYDPATGETLEGFSPEGDSLSRAPVIAILRIASDG
jgi:hypothetical protein